MLRTLLQGCRRAYTCTCVHGPSPVSRLPTLNDYIHGQNVGFHTTVPTLSLEKDLKGKKRIVKIGQLAKEEHLEEQEEITDLTGLTDAGVTIPTLETHQMLVDGVPYNQIPILHIKSTLNNTLMVVTDSSGKIIARNSCGMEGFKHVKKSTNVAAQATGLSLGLRSIKRGVTSVRVIVKGIGAGRLASMKGLQMAGLKIVSITDETAIPHCGQRPQKVRRL